MNSNYCFCAVRASSQTKETIDNINTVFFHFYNFTVCTHEGLHDVLCVWIEKLLTAYWWEGVAPGSPFIPPKRHHRRRRSRALLRWGLLRRRRRERFLRQGKRREAPFSLRKAEVEAMGPYHVSKTMAWGEAKTKAVLSRNSSKTWLFKSNFVLKTTFAFLSFFSKGNSGTWDLCLLFLETREIRSTICFLG